MGERTLRLAKHLSGLVRPTDEGTDADLLGRFNADRDEAAFALLVRRHGPMVLGVCRRVLGDVHAADDVFQATFLVLARRARSLSNASLLGNWLYGVAHRTALEARRRTTLQRAKERRAAAMNAEARVPGDDQSDLRDVLDRELALLPDTYRSAVVACELEGLSRAEAARRLGWPEGTLSCRLARARSLLAKRLSKYGPSVAGAALVGATPSVGAALVESTSRAAVLVAAGQTAAGVVPVAVLELSHGVMKAMFVSKLKGAVAGLMVVTAVAWTGAAGTWPTASAGPQDQPATKTGKAGKAPRDADADRIAQLERERDELRRQLADMRDRLVALEDQVRLERFTRARVEAAGSSLGLPVPRSDASNTPPVPGTVQPRPGSSDPFAAQLPSGARPTSSAANPFVQPGGTDTTGSATAPVRPIAGIPMSGDGRLPSMTRPSPAVPLVLKAYRLADLAGDEKQAEAVVRVIKTLIEPNSWNEAGGAGVVEYLPAKQLLLVRQSTEVHQQVDALVRLLLESGDPPARPTRAAPGVRP